jgi:hypothetical protein
VAPNDFGAILIQDRSHDDLSRRSVDCLKTAQKEAISPSMSVTAIANLVQVSVERSGCDLMQERFPDVGLVSLNEDHVVSIPAQLGTKPPYELEPSGSASYDNDLSFHGLSEPASD